MKECHKYAVSAGIAAVAETAVIALHVLGDLCDLRDYAIGALHTPGVYLLQILGGDTWHTFPALTIIVLSGIMQYFVIAMACIRLKEFWYSIFKTDYPARLLPAIRSLLWSIASIGIVLTFIVSYQQNRTRGLASQFANQGRRIPIAISRYYFTTSMWIEWPFPIRDKFSSSTDYFNYLVEHKEIDIKDHTYFMIPNVHRASVNQPPSTFGADNNAWAVTIADAANRNFSAEYPDAPFLISRNIGFGNPPEPYREGMTTLDMNGLIESDPLLWGKFGVIVTYGGRVRVLTKDESRQENLNPSGHALDIMMP